MASYSILLEVTTGYIAWHLSPALIKAQPFYNSFTYEVHILGISYYFTVAPSHSSLKHLSHVVEAPCAQGTERTSWTGI